MQLLLLFLYLCFSSAFGSLTCENYCYSQDRKHPKNEPCTMEKDKFPNEPWLDSLREQMVLDLGTVRSIYCDCTTKPTPVVGIGHNVKYGPFSEKTIGYEISCEQIVNIFNGDIETALNGSKELFSNFYSLPDKVKMVIVYLCFQLGKNGLQTFKRFGGAINRTDYVQAAAELKYENPDKSDDHTKLYKQITNKTERHMYLLCEMATPEEVAESPYNRACLDLLSDGGGTQNSQSQRIQLSHYLLHCFVFVLTVVSIT